MSNENIAAKRIQRKKNILRRKKKEERAIGRQDWLRVSVGERKEKESTTTYAGFKSL
jgi:hypothetical protein